MAWRDRFLRHFGPGVLGGLTLGDWLRLLRDNRFALSSRYAVRVLAVTHQSAWNSVMGWYEDRRYASRYEGAAVPPPLFVLGHWRSGTTHLHNLLTVSEGITRSAIERKESRGGHFREDYPDKDAAWGRMNIIVRKGRDGGMDVSRIPIPEMPEELKRVVESMK